MSSLDLTAFEALTQTGAIIPLHDRHQITVQGPDARRYLNGQVTNDLGLLAQGQCLYACLTNAKGQLESDLWITAITEEQFKVDFPSTLSESVALRLERYAIADEVEFTDPTPHAVWHVLGSPVEDSALTSSPKSFRYGQPGRDLIAPPEIQYPTLDSQQADQLRILLGLPAWGSELTPGLLAPEAGIEEIAISYHKGCYIGQEVISRIKRAQKTNRKLLYLQSISPLPAELLPTHGSALLNSEGEEIGEITSAAYHPQLDRCAALAYVKSRRYEPSSGPLFLAGEDGRPSLPLQEEEAPYHTVQR